MSGAEDVRQILVVDDDGQIRRFLNATLTAQGYTIRSASDGVQALEVMQEWQPDLVVTDLVMPQMSGAELCRRIRATSEIPIIVLSVREQEKDKIEALDAGADDYVTKPFHSNELLARVRAQLRRAPKQSKPTDACIEIGDFRIDPESHSVQVQGEEVRLTPKEFDLLLYLACHPGKVITHRKLLAAVWGDTSMEQPQYLHVFVGHLRKKLERVGSQYIVTEPWVGYRFNPGD